MLKELVNVRQHPGEPHRRLFWDDYFQLCVWVDPQNTMLGFELSYDLAGDCRAFRCMPGPELEHYAVDDGESRTQRKATPVLRLDPSSVDPQVPARFRERSTEIDSAIAALVQQKLDDCLATNAFRD